MVKPHYYIFYSLLLLFFSACDSFHISQTSNLKPLAIYSISPNRFLEANMRVTITGKGFIPTSHFHVGGTVCGEVEWISSTEIKCTLSSRQEMLSGSELSTFSSGFAALKMMSSLLWVRVRNPGQEASMKTPFEFMMPPQIDSVQPSLVRDIGGTIITLKGNNFFEDSVITINNQPCLILHYVSESELSCTTPANPVGVYDIGIINKDGQEGKKLNGITYYSPPPLISNIFPSRGPILGGTHLTVTGTDFQNGLSLKIGGQNCLNLTVLPTRLECDTPVGNEGTQPVIAKNPDNQSAIDSFTYYVEPILTIVSPIRGPVTGGTLITITGINFRPGLNVQLGGTDCLNIQLLSSTQVQCQTQPRLTAGSVAVSVIPVIGITSTLNNAFTYFIPTSIANDPLGVFSTLGNELLTITGTGFIPSQTSVKINGLNCTNVLINPSQTSLTCYTPAHTANPSVPVVVQSPNGIATSHLAYVAPIPDEVRFISGNSTAEVGMCLPYQIQTWRNGMAFNVNQPTIINFSSLGPTGHGNWYANSQCSVPLSSGLTINTGNSIPSTLPYFRFLLPGTLTLTASVGTAIGIFSVNVSSNSGQLDLSFGNLGWSISNPTIPTINQSQELSANILDAALYPDGKILLAGTNATGSKITLVRMSADGVVDTSFGNASSADPNGAASGWNFYDLSCQGLHTLAHDPSFINVFITNNNIYVGTTVVVPPSLGVAVEYMPIFAKFSLDGVLDTSLIGNCGNPGVTSVNNQGFAYSTFEFSSFLVSPANLLYSMGFHSSYGGTRFFTSSLSDGSFLGYRIFNPSTYHAYRMDTHLLPNGIQEIVTLGTVGNQIALWSFDLATGAPGVIQTNGGPKILSSGVPPLDLGRRKQMRMLSQSDGKILISADALTNNPDMSFTNYLIRTNLDGSIDTSFASAGVLTDQNPWMGSTYYANGSSPIVAVDSMGRTLMSLSQAAFGLGSSVVFRLSRYQSAGTPDTSFDNNHATNFPEPNPANLRLGTAYALPPVLDLGRRWYILTPTNILIQNDGRIILIGAFLRSSSIYAYGGSNYPDSIYGAAVVRFWP